MVAELRKIDQRLVLHTDDNLVYRRLNKLPYTLRKVPYIQDGRTVAIDLYFDRKAKSTVVRVMNGQLMLGL